MSYPSTFVDIQNAVAAKARMDTADATQLSKIKDWINRAYYDAVVETECSQANTTLNLVSGTNQYTLPSVAKRIKYIVIQQSGQNFYGPPLRLVSLDEILWRRVSSGGSAVTNGTATYYAFSSPNLIDLWPTPGGADTALIYYVAQPATLSADSDLPSLIIEPYATELLETGALIHATDYLKDLISNNQYQQLYQIWLAKFRQNLSRAEGTQSKEFRIPGPRYYAPHDPSQDIGV